MGREVMLPTRSIARWNGACRNQSARARSTFRSRRSYPGGLSVPTVRRSGGLISYGVNVPEHAAQTAPYIDRILKGERPADLPVQAPTRFELVTSLRAAKALGLTLPTSILLRADEVIE